MKTDKATARLDALQYVAKTLRPGRRRGVGDGHQLVGVEPFGKLAEHGGDLVQSTGSMRVADEVQGGRFGGGNEEGSTGSVDVLNGHVAEPLADDEGDAHTAAGERPTSPFKADLELLWLLMRGAVVLRGGEEAGVVAKAKALHQRGDELLGGKAAKGVVLGWHDDVVAACR